MTAVEADRAAYDAGCAWRDGRLDKAAELIRQCFDLDPSRPGLWQQRQAQIATGRCGPAVRNAPPAEGRRDQGRRPWPDPADRSQPGRVRARRAARAADRTGLCRCRYLPAERQRGPAYLYTTPRAFSAETTASLTDRRLPRRLPLLLAVRAVRQHVGYRGSRPGQAQEPAGAGRDRSAGRRPSAARAVPWPPRDRPPAGRRWPGWLSLTGRMSCCQNRRRTPGGLPLVLTSLAGSGSAGITRWSPSPTAQSARIG